MRTSLVVFLSLVIALAWHSRALEPVPEMQRARTIMGQVEATPLMNVPRAMPKLLRSNSK